MSENARWQSYRKGLKNSVFRRLCDAASKDGAQDQLGQLAGELSLNPSFTTGTASFYDYLQPENRKHSQWVCKGTACLASGTCAHAENRYANAGEAMCLGYCYAGGGLLKHGDDGHFSTWSVNDGDIGQPAMPVYDLSSAGILSSDADSPQDLYSIAMTHPDAIISELEASSLRGRGGAGFAFAFKLAACAGEEARKKFIVCNADEGDPGAFSDRYLLEQHPHKVMAGMFATAVAAGATDCVLYIRFEYPEAIGAVESAINEYEQWPDDLSGGIRFHVVEGAGSYVCGEETALLNSIEGLRPEVRVRPPYPAQYGLWGKPTVVSNVETFANIPWVLRHGGDAFAAIGTQTSTGGKLISMDSQFVRPGLYEVDFGMGFEELVYEHAGGFRVPVKALQVGGPLGSVIPVDRLDELAVDFDTTREAGYSLGHAGIIAIPENFPIIDLLRHLFSYMAHESCGKCTPCRVGTAKGAVMLQQSDQQPVELGLMGGLLETLETGSLCALGGGLPLPVRNCLAHFREELEPFFKGWEQTA
ncbi:MAG: formate dehydrogenase [Gammaproteobacteria bacterium]|nr:MAG: formate dehydrogenase [Gammaproteobacteria bacterium]